MGESPAEALRHVVRPMRNQRPPERLWKPTAPRRVGQCSQCSSRTLFDDASKRLVFCEFANAPSAVLFREVEQVSKGCVDDLRGIGLGLYVSPTRIVALVGRLIPGGFPAWVSFSKPRE